VAAPLGDDAEAPDVVGDVDEDLALGVDAAVLHHSRKYARACDLGDLARGVVRVLVSSAGGVVSHGPLVLSVVTQERDPKVTRHSLESDTEQRSCARSVTHGHVQQLDQVNVGLLAGSQPGARGLTGADADGFATVDVDDTRPGGPRLRQAELAAMLR
jgi:hypothetical protein